MAKRSNHLFWLSYSDLMTSLFFVVLVLYILSFVLWKEKAKETEKLVKETEKLVEDLVKSRDSVIIRADKYKIIENVEKNLEPLRKDSTLFLYDEKYKRFHLSFDVLFEKDKFKISPTDLVNYEQTKIRLDSVSKRLFNIVQDLKKQKLADTSYRNISYMIVISGSASDLPGNSDDHNYILSFKRAYNLYKYWDKSMGIDFDEPKYHNLIDFQIAGNGIGGIGRFPRDPENDFISETKNQRFIINIIPKIGKLN